MAFRFFDFALDPAVGSLHGPDGEIRLRPKTLALLEALATAAPAVLGKDELMDRVWGQEHLGGTSLAQAVSELRRALGDDPRSPRIIETLYRRGYRFIAPLEGSPMDGQNAVPGPVPSMSRGRTGTPATEELEARLAPALPLRPSPLRRWTLVTSLTVLCLVALVLGSPRVQSQPVDSGIVADSRPMEPRAILFVAVGSPDDPSCSTVPGTLEEILKLDLGDETAETLLSAGEVRIKALESCIPFGDVVDPDSWGGGLRDGGHGTFGEGAASRGTGPAFGPSSSSF